MKLDIKLDKDDEENVKFSMDCDKEFSDVINDCVEGWGIIIHEAIKLYGAINYPTPVHSTEIYATQIHDIPEKEEPEIVIRECEDTIHTDTCTRTGSDPIIPDPVGKDGDVNNSEWNGETTHAPSK